MGGVKSRSSLWIGAAIAASGVAAAHAEGAPLELSTIEDVEELSLGDLLELPVVAASRYAQKPGDSPTLVSTIDHDTIEKFGYRTLADALQGVRGVYTGNDRNYSYLGARGFSAPGDYNTRFALAIDDHRINDPIYGQAPPGAELGIPMIAIEKVELIRGGAFSIYGQNALLGAVQVVTASGATRPGLHVTSMSRATAETFDDPAHRDPVASRGEDVAASYGAVGHGLDVFVAGAYSFDPGLSAIYMPELAASAPSCLDDARHRQPCDGVVRGRDAEEAGSLYASLRSAHWTFHAFASRRRKEVPTASFATVVGGPFETFDTRLYLDGTYANATEHTEVSAHVALDSYNYHGNYPYVASDAADADASPPLVNNYDLGKTLWATGELRGRYHLDHYGAYLSHLALAGGAEVVSATATQLNQDRESDTPPVTYLDRTDEQGAIALGIQASARAFDRVDGFAALRTDYRSTFGFDLSPQAGLVLDGGALGRLRASIAGGLRAPNVYEQFFTSRTNTGAKLGPEHSQTREVSLEHYLTENLRLLVVGYQQNVRDLIVLAKAEDGSGQFTNRDAVRSHGVETELEGRWAAVRVRATYAWQHATTNDGTTPANSPASLASFLLVAPIAGGRGEVGVQSQYVGSRLAFDRDALPATFSTNVVATVHRVTRGLDATFGITNLFDQRSGTPGSEEHRQTSIPNDPRTVWLRLSVALEP